MPLSPCPVQHLLAGMKRAAREDADETPGTKRQRK